jgi:hypothetical protein
MAVHEDSAGLASSFTDLMTSLAGFFLNFGDIPLWNI